MAVIDLLDSQAWEKNETVRLLKGVPGTQYQEANDAGKEQIRNWLKDLLRTQAVTVTFTKADGTDREMLCSLDISKIPPKPVTVTVAASPASVDGTVNESKKPKKEPDPHSLRVFDLEKGEWRSFRFERLKKVSVTLDFQ